jgi:hypothetical protein
MSMLAKHLSLVKDQMDFHQRMATRFSENQHRRNLHRDTHAGFEELLEDLEKADGLLDQMGAESRRNTSLPRIALTPQDIEGLPDEVLKELSISEGDKTEFAILGLIEEAGGILSLDRLIVGMWRKTGEAHKRAALTSRLYRMAQKDLVYNVPTKKGVYASRPISEAEALKLFAGGGESQPR